MSFLARTLLLFVVIDGCATACLGQQGGAAQSPPPRVATPPGTRQRPDGPKGFSSQRGRFTILFPGTPTEKDTSVDTLVGRLDSREYKFAEHPTYYAVVYDDFAGDLEQDAERRDYAMNRMRDAGLSSGPDRRVLGESEVRLGSHPGRALKISIPDGGVIRVRMYAVGRRLYQVSVITLGERSSPGAARSAEKRAMKFLDSFRLITPEAGVR